MKKLWNFINNEQIGPSSGKYLDNVNPATEEVIAQIPLSDKSDVNDAVDAANLAFSTWSKSKLSERVDLLEAVADRIEKKMDLFAETESIDTGKPVTLAKSLDIPRAVSNFRFFAQAAQQSSTGCHPMDRGFNYTLRSPLGVSALITPWNLPLYLLSWKVAPALVMGNTIVAKPSELTPLTASLLAETFLEVGAPSGVFNLIHGTGESAGAPLVSHPKVKAVSFTGGTLSGEKVAAMAAPKFKKLSLELGGKNPTLVFADCDFEKTVKGVARAAFLNQGQICLCGSRILIEKSIYEKFKNALVEELKTWTLGNPLDPHTQFGAVISRAHLDKVQSYLSLAQQEGGKILCGGKRPANQKKGFFLEPTLIDGVSITSRTATEEIFGPVATLHPFSSDQEALEIANCVRYGLSASVWTSNLDRAHNISASLHTGMVWVNTWLLRDLRVPFGGVKDSGVGREGGIHSLEFFSESKNVCIYLGGNP